LKSEDATEAELAEAFQKIGALIVAASQLDVSISKLIAAMAEMAQNPAADMLIHSIDLSRKRQIIESYCSMFDGNGLDAPLDRLAKFSEHLRPVFDDRNTAAHGLLKRHDGKLCVTGYAAVRRPRRSHHHRRHCRGGCRASSGEGLEREDVAQHPRDRGMAHRDRPGRALIDPDMFESTGRENALAAPVGHEIISERGQLVRQG
jgi:hypothetical protein